MKKDLTKKIITTLLVIPMLIQSVGVSYAATNQIAERQVSTRNITSKGVPYNDFIKVRNKLTPAYVDTINFIYGVGSYSGVIGKAVDTFGVFVSYTDQAFGTSLDKLDTSMEAASLVSVANNFKFLKNPDNVSCKVEYLTLEGRVTYERFKNSKYMYALNKSNTRVYRYAAFANKTNKGGYKTHSFNNNNIEVYGIVNGYAHTPYGFIKTSDLTSTKPAAPVAVSSVGLNSTSITLKNIRNYKLTATVSPSNASNKTITWTSSNGNVAKVDQNGNVTAVNEGTATITAKSNNGKTATCKVTVINPASVAVSNVGLNSTSITLKNIRNYKLTATVSPSNASNKTITWTSSNSNIAKVDQNGNVTAVNEGTATITAKSNNGKTATCKVTVINPASVAVSNVGLNSTSITLKNIRNYKLTATVSPSNASNKTIIWTSSNSNVARVDANGNVTAVNAGTATITAKSNNGKTTTCKVTVINPASVAVSSVGLKSSTTIVKGKTEKLTATVSPSNASNKAVTWTSSNSNVARVDANGNVTAVNAGTATITAKSNNGKIATCKVTVNNPYKTRAVKFTVNVPASFKQKHYVEILDANNNVIYTSAVKTGSSIYNFTYQLDTSSSSYTRKIRIRTASDNKRYDSVSFKINSSTINKNVTATFTSGTTANSLKTGQIVQK